MSTAKVLNVVAASCLAMLVTSCSNEQKPIEVANAVDDTIIKKTIRVQGASFEGYPGILVLLTEEGDCFAQHYHHVEGQLFALQLQSAKEYQQPVSVEGRAGKNSSYYSIQSSDCYVLDKFSIRE